MNTLNSSKNVLMKGKGERKRKVRDALEQVGGFDSKLTLANILCCFPRLTCQSEVYLGLFNSLGKRG